MTKADLQRTALKLPPQDRQELVEVLWRSLEVEPAPLSAWPRDLLDERLAALEQNPEEGAPWDEVEKRVWPEGE